MSRLPYHAQARESPYRHKNARVRGSSNAFPTIGDGDCHKNMKKFLFTPLALRCANSSSSQSMKGYLPFLSVIFLAASCGVGKSPDTGGSGSPGGAFDYAPDASPDFYTIDEDAGEILLDVLANDSDQNGNALTLRSIDDVIVDGTASIVGDDISFTADADFNGVITFSYVVEDSTGMQDIGVVTVDVLSINDAPRSEGIADTVDEGAGPITYDILIDANAFDVEGEEFFLESITDPDNGGDVIILNDTQFTYQPTSDFWGVETFTFRLTDIDPQTLLPRDSSDHVVTITVTDFDDQLVVSDGSVSTDEDVSVEIDLADFADNIDNQVLTLSSLSMGAGSAGTVTPLAGTLVLYTPALNYNNSEVATHDFFDFTLNDGFLPIDEVPGRITMTVNAVNDAPTSDPVHGTTIEDIPFYVEVIDAVSDIDEGDTFTASFFSGETTEVSMFGGTVELFQNKFIYTSAPNSNNFIVGGDDGFDYVITDSGGASILLHATVGVTPFNDPITVVNGSRSTPEDSSLLIDLRLFITNVDEDVLNLLDISIPPSFLGTVSFPDPNEPLMALYTPADNFHGEESFSFTVNDGVENSGGDVVTEGTGVVVVTVVPVNDDPTAENTVITFGGLGQTPVVEEDVATVLDITDEAGIDDVDGDTLVYTFPATTANGGTINSGSGPQFQYTSSLHSNSGLDGDDSFIVTVDDQNGGAVISITVNVVVTAVTDPILGPVADPTNPVLTMEILIDNHLEDTSVDYDVIAMVLALADPGNVDFDVLTMTHWDDSIAGGIVTPVSTGIVRFTPAADFNSVENGVDEFHCFIGDGDLTYDITLRFDILDANDAPVAIDGNETAIEDLSLDIFIVDSYVTDVDPFGNDPVTINAAVADSGATVIISGDGRSIEYTPVPNDNTHLNNDIADVITFTVNDNSGATNDFASATILVFITPVNDAPEVAASFTVELPDHAVVEDIPFSPIDVFFWSDVIDVDDRDNDHSSLTVISHGSILNGSSPTIGTGPEGDGEISYKSHLDGPIDSQTGLPVGDGRETVLLEIASSGFDENGDPNILSTFVYMHVLHRAVNDAPSDGDFTSAVDEDTPLILDLVIDTGATDVEGDVISLLDFDPVSINGGVIALNSVNEVTYTPAADFEGTDTFGFTLTDDGGLVDPADPLPNATFTMTVVVRAVNDAPRDGDFASSVDEDNSLNVDLVSDTGATDVEGDDISLLTFDGTSSNGGVIAFNGGNKVTYTPAADFEGTDTFGFTLTDDGGLVDPSDPLPNATFTMTVVVNAINDAPRGNDFASSVDEDTPLILDLVIESAAIDVEFDDISLTEVDADSIEGGVIALNGGNEITYTPAADFEGTDSFTFKLTDSQPENSTSELFTVTITVTPVPDAPVANDDSFDDPIEALKFWRYSGPIDITSSLLANDTDADDGDVPVIESVDDTLTTGDVSLELGVLAYEPAEGVSGVIDTFEYDVSDGDLTSEEKATVTIDIAPNNSVKYMGQDGDLQSTRSLSKADEDGYTVIVDVPGEYASVIRISDVDSLNLGQKAWEVSLVTPADPTLALLVDSEVASNSSNEAVVAAIYSTQLDAVLVTGINDDGSLGFSAVLTQASGLSATIGIEGLALDGLGGCIVGLRLDDGTLRITHLDADGLILDSQVVDPSFGTINSIERSAAGDYDLAMSTGTMKLDSSLLGVYHFGNTGSPININSVRAHAAGIVVAGSNGYLALIDDITVPATPAVLWSKDVSGATLETVEFNDLVSNIDGNVYAAGKTSDDQPAFYSVDGLTGDENFVMRTYSSPWDSAEFNTLTQSDGAPEQSLVGSMSVGPDSNSFRFEASNIDGFPVLTCSPDGHGITNSGFLSDVSVVVMSVTGIVDTVDGEIISGVGPVTSVTTSLFRRRANL